MNNLLNGDSNLLLKTFQENFFDSCVTDPPYHLESIVKRFGKVNSAPAKVIEGNDAVFSRSSQNFLGQNWDGGDIAFTKDFWSEVFRVMKPGGHLLAFSACKNYHRMAVAIEDAGFEIRDMLSWNFGTGFPKSHDIGKQLGEEWKGYGTALKPAYEPIVMARKPLSEPSIAKNILRWGVGAINIGDSRISHHGESNDRYPSNWLLDGSEEVLSCYDDPKVARYFYCPKTSKIEKTDSGKIANNHPTVKPVDLMKWLVRLVTPKDGKILDPFMGSGSTGIACKALGREFYGIEQSKDYFEIAITRIENFVEEIDFFS